MRIPREKRRSPSSLRGSFRAIDGTRTRDIRDHNAALYQLSYDRRSCTSPYNEAEV